MSEDVKPEVIKKTQETLGKFIKKPTLTEKLLKKPPFRFLHDICTSVTKETGFFEGVLSQEDQYENIKDKEGKIAFLQKVIAAVEVACGVKLGVKPNKVVAGLEATKTNEFLQAIGKALEKQQLEKKSSKSTPTVKAKSTKKTGKEVKEEPPDKKKSSSRSSKKIVENGVNETSDSKVKNNVPTAESPKKKHSSKKVEQITPREDDGDNIEEANLTDKNLKNGYGEDTKGETVRRSSVIGAGDSKDVPDENIVKVNGVKEQGYQNHMGNEDAAQNEDQRSVHAGKPKHRRLSIHNAEEIPKAADISADINENLSKKTAANGDGIASNQINVINKSDFHNESPPSSSSQLNYSKKETSLVREGTLISRPRTGIRPTTARPASARPAAPRIRDRGEVVVPEETLKPTSGKVQVIVDEETANEADDDNLISLETTTDIVLEESATVLPSENITTEHEHGHLVEQILEVQRELEDDAKFAEQKEHTRTEIEWESGRNKESTNREIEKLRTSIQTLTRSVNPLGKLLDFFQEDFEIIQKELESWKEKNASYSLQIAQEKSETEQYVEPLKIHLKEIQKNIDEQLDQISIVKANILKNNDKINKLLSGM